MNNKASLAYHRALDNACTMATTGIGWDDRFLKALKLNGLKLTNKLIKNDNLYPGGYPFCAPRPFDNKNLWPQETYVVWISEDAKFEKKIKHPLGRNDNLVPIQHVLESLASQENCDGEPYDQMVEAAQYIDELEEILNVDVRNSMRLLLSITGTLLTDDIPKGLDPTMYITCNYEEDRKLQVQVKAIVNRYNLKDIK
jgi:hypothetical protein